MFEMYRLPLMMTFSSIYSLKYLRAPRPQILPTPRADPRGKVRQTKDRKTKRELMSYNASLIGSSEAVINTPV